MNSFESFLAAAGDSGWLIEKCSALPKLPTQYKNIPEEYKKIISEYSTLSNGDMDCWFILNDDLTCSDPDEFAWDTFQKLSLECCDDEEECAEISAWWDDHFPIIMSVGGEYRFYAIELSTGHIVEGCEPIFENVTVFAEDLEAFFRKIVSDGKICL